MKRIILLCIVFFSVGWIFYSSYELWINKDNSVQPENVFCSLDGSILLINQFEEAKETDYLKTISQNPLAPILNNLDLTEWRNLKIYASTQRPILIFEKDGNWNRQEVEKISSSIKLNKVQSKQVGTHLLIFQDYEKCNEAKAVDFLKDADKKASANYWTFKENNWQRTDIYNLKNGFFEYRSGLPDAVLGRAVKDIPYFSPQVPIAAVSYLFWEKFYAEKQDSIFKSGPMNQWVDKGFVKIDYDGEPVIISDYKTQQVPNLILLEQAEIEDSVQILEDMYSFTGFQLTTEFPRKKEGRFYCFEIEDKVLFVESKKIARKILVDYQLGKMLSLSPERQEEFFGGLPSRVNMRSISTERKSSLTWKDKLLFEVNTLPPEEQLNIVDKTTWSVSAQHETVGLVPIIDHLRGGISVLNYSKSGDYELFGANGKSIWKGSVKSEIEGKVRVIDIFDNQKQQFLFRTKKQVHLIDLNDQAVGGFPYYSDNELTTEISDFVWNGTKRFLVGNHKGELIMLNSGGRELNIIQVGKDPLAQTPYALNVKGSLRAWSINSNRQTYLGYLETPAKATSFSKNESSKFIKRDGKILTFTENDEGTFYKILDFKNNKVQKNNFIDKGKIVQLEDDFITILNQNEVKVFDKKFNVVYNKKVPFNEIGKVIYFPKVKVCIVFDYLQNKIHAYDKLNEELNDFPKEGRSWVEAAYHEKDKTLYVYTLFDQSIVCYKIKM